MTKKNNITLPIIITGAVFALAVIVLIIALVLNTNKKNDSNQAIADGVSSQTVSEIKEAGKRLVYADYDIARIFKLYSIPTKANYNVENYPDNVVPCNLEGYSFTNYAQLEEYVRSTFVASEAEAILNEVNAENQTQFLEVNGEFCKVQFFLDYAEYNYNWDELTLEYKNITNTSATVDVTRRYFEPAGLTMDNVGASTEPTYSTISLNMVKVDGEWLLEKLVY